MFKDTPPLASRSAVPAGAWETQEAGTPAPPFMGTERVKAYGGDRGCGVMVFIEETVCLWSPRRAEQTSGKSFSLSVYPHRVWPVDIPFSLLRKDKASCHLSHPQGEAQTRDIHRMMQLGTREGSLDREGCQCLERVIEEECVNPEKEDTC